MIEPRKRLGQNFLRDPNTARKIVASVTAQPADRVIEIGAGTGALTGFLARRFNNLSAIEIDPRATDHLKEEFPSVHVIEKDVLECSYAELRGDAAGRLYVVGNLPYYLTSEILFRILDESAQVKEAVFMMQYEVARRLVAVPRTKEYGILSVAVQLEAHAEILFPVSRNVFFPKPDVRSAVVRLTFSNDTGAVYEGCDRHTVRKIIRTAFNQRRKTLRNSLKGLFSESLKTVPSRYSPLRAEELVPKDFIELARYLHTG